MTFHIAEQATHLDLDLGTIASSDLDLPIAKEAEPAFPHAATRRNAQHQITGLLAHISNNVQLGSANILMEPDDRYLCHVWVQWCQARHAAVRERRGAQRHPSKLVLLAADDKTPTPRSWTQLRRRA